MLWAQTAREKCPNTEFFLVRIFPHSDWIGEDTPYLSVFNPNAGKYWPEKAPYLNTFHTVRLQLVFFSVYFHTVHNSKTCPCWTVPDLAKCFAWTCKKDFVFKISDRIPIITFHTFHKFRQLYITLGNSCLDDAEAALLRYFGNMQQIYRRIPMPKRDFINNIFLIALINWKLSFAHCRSEIAM